MAGRGILPVIDAGLRNYAYLVDLATPACRGLSGRRVAA